MWFSGSWEILGFPDGSDGKESTCSVQDLGSIPGLGRSSERGHDNPLQYSCPENPHGQRSLTVYSPWSRKKSDTTGQLSTLQQVSKSKTHVLLIVCCFPDGSADKESACNSGDATLIPELGRSLGGGNGNSLQYFHWKNPTDREALATVQRVEKSQTQLTTQAITPYLKNSLQEDTFSYPQPYI